MCLEILWRKEGHPQIEVAANSLNTKVTECAMGLSSRIVVFPTKRAASGQNRLVSACS